MHTDDRGGRRRSGRVAFALAAWVALAVSSPKFGHAAASTSTLRVDARDVLLFLSFAPLGVSASASHRLLPELDALLLDRTSITAKSTEQLGIDRDQLGRCEADVRISCWLRALLARGDQSVRFLLVLGTNPVDANTEQWSFILVDVAEARRLAPDLEGPGVEEQIDAATTWIEPRNVDVSDRRQWRDSIETALLPEIEARLAKTPEAGFGSVSIRELPSDLELRIDGRIIGVTDGRPMTLLDVRPGVRQLAAQARGGGLVSVDVTVQANEVVNVVLPAIETPLSSKTRLAVGVVGATMFAAGASLLVAGLAQGQGDVRLGCFGASESAVSCARISSSSARSIEVTPSVSFERGGLSLEATGAGLSVTGAGLGLAAWSAESELALWLQVALGFALGAATSVAVVVGSGG